MEFYLISTHMPSYQHSKDRFFNHRTLLSRFQVDNKVDFLTLFSWCLRYWRLPTRSRLFWRCWSWKGCFLVWGHDGEFGVYGGSWGLIEFVLWSDLPKAMEFSFASLFSNKVDLPRKIKPADKCFIYLKNNRKGGQHSDGSNMNEYLIILQFDSHSFLLWLPFWTSLSLHK